MKIERTKNATKNIVFGTILKIYQIIVPFLMRTAMINYLGVQYLGLNSLFTSILQVLNLAELGVGSAMIFSMYKPISEDDTNTICALMKLYKIYYRVIGAVILVVGTIICPFVPYLIKSDLPVGMNVYILYILNLLATVFSYWICAYKNSILQAHQRTDVISKITLIVNTIQYIFQLLTILILKDYYIYVMVSLIAQVIINIITAMRANKMYPKYKPKGNLSKEAIKNINQRVKDLFTAKVGGVIVNSVDTIVVSAFLGLTVLAIYQNYYYILTSIIGIMGVVFTSCTAGIGNSIILESKEKNYKDLRKFTFIVSVLSIICTSELLCLYQPFMKWWVGEELLLDFTSVICFCAYFFIYEENILLCTYKDAAGIWHADRFRPLITGGINLILDIILVKFIGVYGVILSTVISIGIIGLPWLSHVLFKEIFKTTPKEYFKEFIQYIIVLIIVSCIAYFTTNIINEVNLLSIFIKAIICLIINVVLIYIIFRKKDVFSDFKELIRRTINKKS